MLFPSICWFSRFLRNKSDMLHVHQIRYMSCNTQIIYLPKCSLIFLHPLSISYSPFYISTKNKRERQVHLSCTCRSLLGITFFPQNPWIPVHPLSQGMHPRRHFPPSYNRRPRYLRPYGRLRLLFLPCRRFSANHLPPEICLRTCPQCPDRHP